jgi:hypothetical protein
LHRPSTPPTAHTGEVNDAVPFVRVAVPSTPCVAAEKVIVPVGSVPLPPPAVLCTVDVSVNGCPYVTPYTDEVSEVEVAAVPPVADDAPDLLAA